MPPNLSSLPSEILLQVYRHNAPSSTLSPDSYRAYLSSAAGNSRLLGVACDALFGNLAVQACVEVRTFDDEVAGELVQRSRVWVAPWGGRGWAGGGGAGGVSTSAHSAGERCGEAAGFCSSLLAQRVREMELCIECATSWDVEAAVERSVSLIRSCGLLKSVRLEVRYARPEVVVGRLKKRLWRLGSGVDVSVGG